MSFMQKFVPSFMTKDDIIRKQLKKINLYTDDLSQKNIKKGIELFNKQKNASKQQQALKALMKLMDEKTLYARKLKLICFLIQISKETKYDVADILVNKKLKIFTKSNIKVKLLPPLQKSTLEQFIYIELVVPLYNYFMKLSLNEELFNICISQQIPNDDIFRRGTKIRFIWIFKIYNLIHILIPILQSLLKFLITFPNLKYFQQIAQIYYNDMIMMNNFIVKAIQQAANDNYILMPYFDMLQFYESLAQQIQINKKISLLSSNLTKYIPQLRKPQSLNLSAQQISEIEVQALRVKLISNSLKNPKKDHTRLQTQYNVKAQIRDKKQRQVHHTQGNGETEEMNSFRQKYLNIDRNNRSLEEVDQHQQEDQDNF